MKPREKVVGVLMVMILIASCEHKKQKKASPTGFSDQLFTEQLQTMLKPADTAKIIGFMSVQAAVRLTYQLDGYEPIWVKINFKPTEASGKLLDEIEDLRWDGLDPERYNLTAIRKLKIKLDTNKTNSVKDAIVFDTMLTHSYLAASKDLLLGLVQPGNADSLWFHTNDTLWSVSQILADTSGKYHSLNDYRSELPTYSLLRNEYKHYYELIKDTLLNKSIAKLDGVKNPDSVMMATIYSIIKTELPWVTPVPNDSESEEYQMLTAYQGYAGVKQTGKPDSSTLASLRIPADSFLKKISANMERIRWMQKEFGKLYLIVDVPLMELFLKRDGANAVHMRVVVGRRERQTPSLNANMANVVINPSWGVPPTILKKDVLPGLVKSGKKYLSRKGLKAYDNDGNAVDPSFINAHNYRRYTYKQAPGDDNSLGYVKFNFPNHWDVYMHDTPHRGDFVKRDRFLSSGCVRVQRPKEMAVYILSELEKMTFTMGKLDSMIRTHKTRWEILKNKIPVHIAYLTAFEDTTGTHIQFVRDIYHRDGKLISLLN